MSVARQETTKCRATKPNFPPLWLQGRVRGSRGGVAACLALFLMNFDVLCDDADEQEVDAVRPSMSTSESQ